MHHPNDENKAVPPLSTEEEKLWEQLWDEPKPADRENLDQASQEAIEDIQAIDPESFLEGHESESQGQ